MAGLLDFLNGTNAGATPWPIALSAPYSALYPSPLLAQMPTATGQAPDANAAAAYGAMGVDPSAFALPTPPASPFPQQAEQPKAPDLGDFGKGAVPFGFAGPTGMMSANSGAAPAAPTEPVPLPQPRPAAADAPPVAEASAPTDISSVNRGAAAAAAPVSPGAVNAMTAPAPAAAPFSLGGAGASPDAADRFKMATRGFIGNMASGPIGAIMGGLGAAITGQETDPTAIARQKMNASAQALVSKGASPAEAAAAVNNPALMTALINQYYGKDKWAVVKTGKDAEGNEHYMQQNQMDGTLRELPAGASTVAGGAAQTVTGPDGKPIQIPPGVDRKAFIKRISEANADAATGKKTEAQAKASSFAARMQKAEQDLSTLQDQGLSATQAVAGSVPLVGNYLQSTDHQRYETAKSAFITAMLRQESGAAINKSEFARYEKELFPQPGDAPAVVQQKAALRAAAVDQMKGAAGPGYQAPTSATMPKGSVNVGGQTINWSAN